MSRAVRLGSDDLLAGGATRDAPRLEEGVRTEFLFSGSPSDSTNDEENAMVSIRPFLWFDTELSEVISYYTSIFPDTLATSNMGDGPVNVATIELCGQELMLLNGGPAHAGFTESISLFVSVDSQAEVDQLWERLTSGGGQTGRCGWLKDRYGLSSQIVPSVLSGLLGSPDRERAQQALEEMLTMDKLDVAALQAAYDR